MEDWIKEIILNRDAQVSTVIIVETNDPKRKNELFNYIYREDKEGKPLFGNPEWKRHDLLHFDVWEGLTDLKTRKSVSSGSSGVASALMGSGANLPQALKKVDEWLKTKKTVFIITGLINSGGGDDRDLSQTVHAITNWCFHPNIFRKESTVIILMDDATVFPAEILNRVPVISPPISREKEREKIINQNVEILKIKTPGLKCPVEMIALTAGLNLHQTETVIMKSVYRYKTIEPRSIITLKKDIIEKSGVLEIFQPKFGFESIGGYNSVKDFVTQTIIKVFKERKRAEMFGVSVPRGALLFGPPGTGKTLFANAIAKATDLPLILLKTENIFSSLVGGSERKMKTAIDLIESLTPAIVFMDEIDRMGTRQDISTDSGTSRRVFSQMLEYLGNENRGSIIIGTTNLVDALDPAFIRTGRFDKLIPILYPDPNARKEIFNVHMKIKRQIPLGKIDIDEIVEKTARLTGAEIEDTVKRAALIAFNEEGATAVTQDHFIEAIDGFKIDETQRDREMEKYLKQAEDFCNDKNFLAQARKELVGEDARIEALKAKL